MNIFLAVAAGGALGASGRYLTGLLMARLLGTGFPWGTLSVNIIGSFLMGLLVEAIALKWELSPEWRAFLTTGLLGGFTTFSAFSLDVAVLVQRKDHLAAGLYMAGSVGLSIGALFCGLYVARHWLGS